MQRKIFIGIDLPGDVKKRLIQRISKWSDFPVIWTPAENFHVTILFLGYVDDEKLYDICLSVKNALSNSESFELAFDRIEIVPLPEDPKYVWLKGKPSEELRKLQETLEKELGIFVKEKKTFSPHVTLGRIKKKRWKELGESVRIEEPCTVSAPVEDITIFESKIEKGKRMYDPLEVCALK